MSPGQDGAVDLALARLAQSRTRLALDLARRGPDRSLPGGTELSGVAVLAVQWALRRHPITLALGLAGLGAVVLLGRQRRVRRGAMGTAAPRSSDVNPLATPLLSLALTALAAAARR